VAVLESALVI